MTPFFWGDAATVTMSAYLLQETYPTTPPVWFSESEDAKVTSGLSGLSETSGLDNHLLYQERTAL